MSSNENINLMRSDPKNSIMKLAIPIMATMLIITLYNVVDGIWIAGLGRDAITGIGLYTPLFMIMNGLSAGLSNGATSSIGRFREESDEKANRAGEQSILVFFDTSIILSIILGIILVPFIGLYTNDPIVLNESINYGLPFVFGLITFVFSMGLSGILRAEGDTKRAMYAMATGSILNAILDPVFIYILGMGSFGAAFSTIFTSLISMLIMIYWIFVKKDTYIKLNIKNIIKYKISWEIRKDILKTGIPASFVLFMLSFASMVLYYFIYAVNGTLGVSIFSTGNRIYLFGLMPISGICSALVAIVATHFGSKNIEYIKRTLNYGCLYSTLCGIITSTLFILLAKQITMIFAVTSNDAALIQGIETFIVIIALCYPFFGLGSPATFFYQGLGEGMKSFFASFLSEIICTLPSAYLFAFCLNYGLIGIWIGCVVGRGIACIINFILIKYHIRKLEQKWSIENN